MQELIPALGRGKRSVGQPVEEAGYQTNFERKTRLKGTPVWRAVYERTGEAVSRGRP